MDGGKFWKRLEMQPGLSLEMVDRGQGRDRGWGSRAALFFFFFFWKEARLKL